VRRGGVAAAAVLLLLLGAAPPGAAAQEQDSVRPDPAADADTVPPLADTVEVDGAGRAPPEDTLSLEDALRTALAENPDVRSARTRASAEAAARWADWGAFLPRASASMNVSRSDVRTETFVSPEGFFARLPEPRQDVNKGVSQSLSLQWTLLEGGRRIADLQAGSAAADAARIRVSEAERRAMADVKVAFLEARKQQRLAEIARQQLENRRRELERARQRYRIAAVDRADLLGAQVEVRRAELNLLESRDAARRARRQLRVAMGDRSRADATDFALGDVPAPPDPGGISADALAERAASSHPEVRALEAEVESASSQLWASRSSYLPTVQVGFSHSRTEQFPRQGPLVTFEPSNRTNRFSISASWDLFTGFQRREQTARASAELDRARIDRARLGLEIEKTVRDVVDEVDRRARRVELLREQLDRAEERLELLSEQYRLGSATFDQLQRAIDDVTRAERDLVAERHDYLAAWARLERWAGDVAPGLPSPAVDDGAGSGPDDGASAGGRGPEGPDRR
jgi:outer membrane protein TolC